MEVIGNFFQVLGVEPAIGRLFTLEESRSGAVVPNSTAQPFALLANAYWRRQFHSDPTIVGRAIELNGAPVTVVGVLPQSFDYGAVFSPGAKADLFVPVSLDKERMWGNIVTLVGRLKPGVTEAQALDDANRVAPDIYFNVKYPESRGRYKGNLVPIPLKDYVTGKLRRSLIALWFAVGTILLIAGVNLSNLLLARAAARAKEFAVRGALGAGRGRIVRQLLMESFVLSGAGALLGLGLAVVVIRWLAHQGSLALPLLSSLRIDNQALAWTLLVTVLTATVFGLLPGLRIARGNLQEVLKDSGAGAGLGRKHERIRAALVVSEIALACVLLVSAGLLLRSFSKVLEVDLGFQPDHAWSINVEYDDSAPSQEASVLKRSVAFQQIVARVGAIPGVQAVGISDYLPLGPNRSWDTPVPKGRLFAPGELPEPLVYVITPGFIRAMGMRLQGRDFTWSDGPKSERVIIINSSMARRFWPGEDPIGKILMRGDEQDHVVGVVDDVHEESVETSVGAQVYYPSTQQGPSRAQLVVRSNLSPELLAPNVLRGLRELNPNQSAAEFRPIRTIVDHAVSPRRFFMLLVTAFAGLGLLLATLGIYGVISYTVTRQTPEIGVRMALGATGGRVQRQVLANTLRLTATGIALGSVIAIAVARAIASLLFATSPWDLPSYLGMATALLLVALASGYVPARRASSINPMDALRSN
jgi:predicted permease